MFINIGGAEYELSSKLGVAMSIERKFKMPLGQVFEKLETAEIPELVSILAIAAAKTGDAAFTAGIEENWDYLDLQLAVQELLTKLMFSGTPEQIEAKIEKYPVPENQKNAMREWLGIPTPAPATPSTGND